MAVFRAATAAASSASARPAAPIALLAFFPPATRSDASALTLQNTTGATLDSFSLSYDGEQWRSGDPGLTDSLLFSYAIVSASPSINGSGFTDVSSLTYSATAAANNTAVDGNASANVTSISGTISGLTWNPGDYLVLRWTGQDVQGQDNGLAVDNLKFSAVPEPATWFLISAAGAGIVIFRRRNRVRA